MQLLPQFAGVPVTSKAWQRRIKREAKKKRQAAQRRKRDIKAAAVTLSKVITHFTARWHQERAKTLRRALDVLAGEGLAL
jgi:iron-sulfur cluster repair protein YtfE (RIC family)